MTISEVNALTSEEFVEKIGWVFEHSPWVAERAFPEIPFASVEALHRSMVDKVKSGTRKEQLELLRAHPDLGTRARVSDASASEQAGVGLDRLTQSEYERLKEINAAYRDRFGFPFLFAVKGATKHQIMAALERRVDASERSEFEEALQQVYKIAGFRLYDLITG